jgi:hypothetical protein
MGAKTRMNSVCSGLQLESVQRTQPTWLGIKILLVSVGRVVVSALSSDVDHCMEINLRAFYFVVGLSEGLVETRGWC